MEGNDEMCSLPRSPIMEGRLEVTRLQAGDPLGKMCHNLGFSLDCAPVFL